MENGNETMTVWIDSDTLDQASIVFGLYDMTVEQAIEVFVQWVVNHPGKAKTLLLKWKAEQEEKDNKNIENWAEDFDFTEDIFEDGRCQGTQER